MGPGDTDSTHLLQKKLAKNTNAGADLSPSTFPVNGTALREKGIPEHTMGRSVFADSFFFRQFQSNVGNLLDHLAAARIHMCVCVCVYMRAHKNIC